MPAFKVSTVDTTAAGDAFVAGLLLRLVETGVDAGHFDAFIADESAIADALRHAAAAGALAATKHGAFAAMPTRDELQTLLRSEP